MDIARKKHLKKASHTQLIRDFYLSGVDMKNRNRLGYKPIKEILDHIDRIDSRSKLLAFIAERQKKGFPLVWSTSVYPDEKNSGRYAVYITENALSLPSRDFYLKRDSESEKIRKAFLKHITRIFLLVGVAQTQAIKDAKLVLDFETRLAKASMKTEELRDVEKTYNKKKVSELKLLVPEVEWLWFFKHIDLLRVREVIVTQLGFMRQVSAELARTPLSTWRAYMRWSTAISNAYLLSDNFVNEEFNFFGKTLVGLKKKEPEWKRVIDVLDSNIGEALGKEYVKRYFPPEAKKKVDDLVEHLFSAYRKRIGNVDWMSKQTKEVALKKLSRMKRKIGYPDKWKSYQGLLIDHHSYAENVFRATHFEQKREFARLHKRVDQTEWYMTPQTVNAYYAPSMNEIVFPAGILQPPLYSPEVEEPFNYGAIGSIIGHEMTHGFDDTGAKFDHKGNFNNWWSHEDKRRFIQKTRLLVTQFNQYNVENLFVNGKLTLGENIADLGGLTIAYDALEEHLKHNKNETWSDFTPQQLFFLGFATAECAQERPERSRTMVLVDQHAPPIFRVNGPLSNFSKFYEVYGVKRGDKLYRAPGKRVEIW